MTASVTNDWSEGAINSTGVTSNLAINGNGFFVVEDPNSSAQYLTQDGTFSLNTKGQLVTSTGDYVMGYGSASLSGTLAPITIDTTGMPATSDPNATMTSYTINGQGIVTVNLSDGTSFARGQILLQNSATPQALTSVGNNLYSNWPTRSRSRRQARPVPTVWAAFNPAHWNCPMWIFPRRWPT